MAILWAIRASPNFLTEDGWAAMEIDKVGKAIAYLRKRAGYTQKDLADRIGVSDKAVSKWERGLGLPDVSCLRKLSILLDTDTDSLLAGDVIHHGSGWNGLLVMEETPGGISLSTILYDKPMVYYLLSYFLLVGIKDILILCSEEEERFVQREFHGGDWLGIRLLCSHGSLEQAVCEFPEFGECSNYMVVYGKTFIYGVDQTRFFQKAMIDREHLTVLSLPRGTKTDEKRLSFDDSRKVISSEYQEEINTQYNYYDIPVLFCPARLLHEICCGENIAAAIECARMQELCLYTQVLDRGFVEITLRSWKDVAAVSGFVKIVQETCGMEIYCVEEIAWRRGMINLTELRRLGEKKADTEYGKYILELCENHGG